VTHWGYALLVTFVALGVSRVSWRKAGRLATGIALAVMAYALHSYGVL
jgi:hypothetical protein